MSTVYLICGNTGAGKSTYSLNLAKQKKAILFSLDPWMQNLYGEDYNPSIHDFTWLTERVERCKVQIQEIAILLIKQNIDVIFDFGFGDKESRSKYKKWAVSLGANSSIHYLDIPSGIRRKRVKERNNEKGATFSFNVTDEMFDYVEPMFVPPTEEELKDGLLIQ